MVYMYSDSAYAACLNDCTNNAWQEMCRWIWEPMCFGDGLYIPQENLQYFGIGNSPWPEFPEKYMLQLFVFYFLAHSIDLTAILMQETAQDISVTAGEEPYFFF